MSRYFRINRSKIHISKGKDSVRKLKNTRLHSLQEFLEVPDTTGKLYVIEDHLMLFNMERVGNASFFVWWHINIWPRWQLIWPQWQLWMTPMAHQHLRWKSQVVADTTRRVWHTERTPKVLTNEKYGLFRSEAFENAPQYRRRKRIFAMYSSAHFIHH